MSLIGKITRPWGICLTCIATICQDERDEVHISKIEKLVSFDRENVITV